MAPPFPRIGLRRSRPFERRPLPVRRPQRSRTPSPPAPRRTSAPGRRSGPHLGLRLSLLSVVVVGLFAVLLLRLWSIQVIGHNTAEANAIQTTQYRVAVQPPRGSIVSRGGQVLAEDETREVVTLACPSAERSFCPGLDSAVVSRLAPLLGTTVSAIDAKLESNQIAPFDPAPIAVGVPYSIVAYLAEHKSEFPGVDVAKTYLRTYPQQSLAAQTIGYVGDIDAQQYKQYAKPKYAQYGYTEQDSQFGLSGIEEQYELALHGKPGLSTFEVNSSGQEGPTETTTQPTPGDELVLNMDDGLEREASGALDSQIAALRSGSIPPGAQPAPWGAVVVLDDRNGDVLAMASDPSYNDNIWVPYISEQNYEQVENVPAGAGEPLVDYATYAARPPGSTFKLVTATAALGDNLITPGFTVDDTGSIDIGGQKLTNSDGEALGFVNVSSALAKSSDIFFYTMGELFWDERQQFGLMPIQDVAAKYGLGVPSGIDLPNVDNGQVDSPQLYEEEHKEYPETYPDPNYYLGDSVQMAFGQGETLLSPLEIANAYATFANGGTRYAPNVAAALVSPSGHVQRLKARPVDHVGYTPTNYEAILQGLEGAVQSPDGTAYDAFLGFNFSAWQVAGKTGTATIGNTPVPTSWFVAFGGPKDQTPKYTVVVEINQGGFGAQASAPVVRDIFNYLYAHGISPLHIPGGSSSAKR